VSHRSSWFPSPSKLKDNAGRKRWTNAINRNIKKGKVWVAKNSSRVCSKHFVDGKPTDENPDPTENLGYDFKAKQTTGGKRKAPLDRSAIPVKKAKRPRKKSSEASYEANQEIPAHIDCDSNTIPQQEVMFPAVPAPKTVIQLL
jgi:hypothetical protein